MAELAVKVVRRTPAGLYSAVITPQMSDIACTEYVVGKWVKARIGKLFAFPSVNDAKRLYPKGCQNNFEVWEAEVRGAEEIFEILDLDAINTERLKKFWSWRKDPGSYPRVDNVIDIMILRMIVCDAIKLVRRLY